MKKLVWTYGLIAGAILGSMFFVSAPFFEEGAKPEDGELFGYITMVIGLSTVFFAVRSLRLRMGSSGLSFKKAFLTGLYIVIIASVMYAVGWMIFFHTQGDGGTMEQYFDQQVTQVEQSDVTEEEKTRKIEEMQSFRELYMNNPLVMFGVTLMEIFPIGLLIALISATVWRKKPESSATT